MNGIWTIEIGGKHHTVKADLPFSMLDHNLSVYFDENLIYKSYKWSALGELYKFEKFGYSFTIKAQGYGHLGRLKLYVNGQDADDRNELPVSSSLMAHEEQVSHTRPSEAAEGQASANREAESCNASPQNVRHSAPKRDLQVFLCHSPGDARAAENCHEFLLNNGISPWLGTKSLLPGQNGQIEIPKAVRDSDAVIVFLSSNSVTKEGFLQKDIRIALDAADKKPDGTIFVIPAKLEECDIPERLAHVQCVNLFERNGYEMLFKALQARANSLGIAVNFDADAARKYGSGFISDSVTGVDVPAAVAASEIVEAGQAQPVYVSYAWGGDSEALVDEIERRLPGEFKLIRDKHEMRPGDWISRFMQEIGRAELVLLVLSEKYLRSVYCMSELLYLHESSLGEKSTLLQRIVPLIVGEVPCARARDRNRYVMYWQKEHAELRAMLEQRGVETTGEADRRELLAIQSFKQQVSDLLAWVADTLMPQGSAVTTLGIDAAIDLLRTRTAALRGGGSESL